MHPVIKLLPKHNADRTRFNALIKDACVFISVTIK